MSSLRSFGQYRLLKKLAAGGMAEIFLAKQVGPHGFERDVVIKRLRPEHHARSDYVTMFFDEARLAARLTHPNVVQIHDLGMIGGHHFLCMEYLAGEDLAYLLRAGKARGVEMPPSIAARLVAEAAHGLHYAHELPDEEGRPLRIVHRDVTPSNLFVTYDGQVKVLDFGVARAESRLTITGDGLLKGKAAYAAPEQVQGAQADRRCDVYMLGLVLYELLTGIQPFLAETPLQMLHAVLAGRAPPLSTLRPDLPENLVALVEKAMSRDPGARFQTAGELAAALEGFLGDYTTTSANRALRAYVKHLVPAGRVEARSHIPSLLTLRARGVAVTGFTDPEVPAVAVAPAPAATVPSDAEADELLSVVEVTPIDETQSVAEPDGTEEVPPPVVPHFDAAPQVAEPPVVPPVGSAAVGAPARVNRNPALFTVSAFAAALLVSVSIGVVLTADARTGGLPAEVESTIIAEAVAGGAHEGEVAAADVIAAWSGEGADGAEDAPSARAADDEETSRAEPAVAEPVSAPVRVPMGLLTLDTVPWTEVYLDRKRVGETPVVEHRLPAGTHRLRLVNPNRGIDRTVQVKVRGNETTRLRLQL